MAQDIEIDLDADTPKPEEAKASNTAPVIDLDVMEDKRSSRLKKATGRLVATLNDSENAQVEIDITQPTLGESEKNNAVSDDEIPNERDLLMQLVGQVQAAKAISQFSQTIGVSRLAHVKESKAYKALKGKTANGLELSGTWVEFCNLIGISDEKANQDIANLKLFGEEALESMNQMGIGYRDLAQYRKLPVDQRTALIAAAETGDKNQFLDLAETIIERHATEKAEQTAAIANLTDDLDRAGKRANNMDAEIERLESEKNRLLKNQRITNFEPFTEDVRQECMHLQGGVELHFNSLNKLFENVFHNESTPEQKLRVEQVYVSIMASIAHAVSVLEGIHDIYDPEFAPKRIQGQQILTPEEAKRWNLEWESLQNTHNAAEASRQIERDAAKPRGRGRPAKSQGE